MVLLKHMLSAQNKLYESAASALVVTYILAVTATWSGRSELLLFGMVLLSPVAMLVLRVFAEDWFDRSFFNPRVMSLSFVFGDLVLLPICLFMAGSGWNELPDSGWHRTWWFASGCWSVGLLAACAFRTVDGSRYVTAGVESALISPTKVWHDWVVIPVVTAALLWLLVPQAFIGGSTFTRPAVVFLVMFFIAVAIDNFIIKPDPARQHPEWDGDRFQVA